MGKIIDLSGPLTREVKGALRDSLNQAIYNENISKKQASMQLGISPGYISLINNEKYWETVSVAAWEKVRTWVLSEVPIASYSSSISSEEQSGQERDMEPKDVPGDVRKYPLTPRECHESIAPVKRGRKGKGGVSLKDKEVHHTEGIIPYMVRTANEGGIERRKVIIDLEINLNINGRVVRVEIEGS